MLDENARTCEVCLLALLFLSLLYFLFLSSTDVFSSIFHCSCSFLGIFSDEWMFFAALVETMFNDAIPLFLSIHV